MRIAFALAARFAALFVCVALGATARADSTVSALPTTTSALSLGLWYFDQGPGTDTKLGVDATLFALSTGKLTIANSSIGNALLSNSATTVNGVSCALGGSCTVTAAAGTLTGGTLAAGVTASSLTSVGTLTGLTMGGTLAMGTNTISGNFTANGNLTLSGTSSVTGPMTFTNSDLLLLGSSTGKTTFTSANAGASNFTLTVPAATDQLVARATTDTLTNKTIAGASNTLTVRLASDVTGNLPVTNLNSGTSASSSTFWRGDGVWAAAGGSSTGVGVQGGQSPSNIGDNATALPSGHYLYQTNVTMTAARSHNLPDSATQGAGDIEVLDSKGTVTTTNTLTVCAAGTDKLNTVTNGCAAIYTASGGVGLSNDGAGNWSTKWYSTNPAPGANQVHVSNASSQDLWGTALPNGITATTQSASDNSTKVATTAYADTSAGTRVSLTATGQSFTGGIIPTAFSNGTATTGTKTIDCGSGPIQTVTNGGAFTLAMATNDGTCVLRVTNNGSAGAITFSGFSEGSNTGDALTTTNTSKFDITLTRIGGSPHYLISALQ